MPEDEQNDANVHGAEQNDQPANPHADEVNVNRPQPVKENLPATTPASADPSIAGANAGVHINRYNELQSVETEKKVKHPAETTGKKLPPGKIGKEKRQAKSNARFFLGCAGGLLTLFVIFVVLMVLVMARGGGDNAVIQAFGLAPGAIRGFLLSIINLAFGFLVLLFFVLMIVGIFRLIGAKKSDEAAKSKGVKMTFFSLIPFILVLIVWFFLYNFIARLEIQAERVVAEIVVLAPKNMSSLQAPVEITFSAANVAKALSQSRLSVQSSDWDLDGDGNYETPMPADGQVTRLYTRRGLYNVTLRVQVAGEAAARSYTVPINIQDALFGAEPDSGTAPLEINFDAGDLIPQGIKMASLDWDFDGDGTYELTGPDHLRPRHIFNKIGTYKVHLRMVDKGNRVENYYREINIEASDMPLLSADILASPGLKGSVPFQVRFDGGKSTSLKGKIIGYEWNFGDGSGSQEGRIVSHIYQKKGLYSVTLIVTEDSGATAEISKNVEITENVATPTAVIVTDQPLTDEGALLGTLPFKIQFDAGKSIDPDNDIIDFEWDLNGDEIIDVSGKTIEHTFESSGVHQVNLTVTDSLGASSQTSLVVQVQNPLIQSVINAIPQEGSVPLVVSFDGSGSTSFESAIVSYEWIFGDGSAPSITGASITHKYSKVGTYNVMLKVVNDKGEAAQSTKQIFVREIPLVACFDPSRIEGLAPLSVTFDPQCSTGSVAAYSWKFGDGVESGSRKPAHTFEKPGTYTVTLEITDDKNNVNITTHVIVVQSQ